MYYPVYLDLRGKPTVVLGGGMVAERKVTGLLAAGAAVTVISPKITEELARLERTGAIRVMRRPYSSGDMDGAYMAIASTDDVAINRTAAEEARRAGALVNTVDDVAYCDFIAPAVVRQGDVTVAISTNGKSPAMARFVREELEAFLTPDYADLLTVLERVRGKLRTAGVQVDPEYWHVHIDSEFRSLVRCGAVDQAEARLLAALTGKERS